MATLAGPSPAAQAVGRDLSSMQVPGGSSILRVIDGMEGVLKSNQAAVHEIQSLYARNVYPDMNIEWGSYPNNIGHEDFLGCFRCHDDQHKSADGKVITQECESCHAVLAQDEANPKLLSDLGLKKP